MMEAVVDGDRSVQCYFDALAGAYGAWPRLSTASGAGDAAKNGSYLSGCSLLIQVEETWLP